MPITPSNFLFFPLKDGKWLRNSQGKPRIYRTTKTALVNLKEVEYDTIQVYALDDSLTREEFERALERII